MLQGRVAKVWIPADSRLRVRGHVMKVFEWLICCLMLS